MRTIKWWQGVRMREVAGAADPEAPARAVTLPAAWEDRAADALAAIVPGTEAVSLAGASGVWLGIVGQLARAAGGPDDLPARLHGLLLRRQGAPSAGVWRGEREVPGYVLNLAAFHVPGSGFDVAAFGAACGAAAAMCGLLSPGECRIGISGLDDLLAALGVPYASQAGRDVAAALAALLRGQAVAARTAAQFDLLATGADWPAPPGCVVPGLTEAAAAARAECRVTPGAPPCVGVSPPGEVDALLGIETAGIAPAFAPVREGRLSRAALDRLAAEGVSPERALAASLSGDDPLPVAPHAAHRAMHDAVAPFLQIMPARPEPLPAPAPARAPGRARARALPAQATGLTQRVTVGGHRVFLRTGEFEDGSLGEVTIALPREGANTRALMECLAQAVTIGLQHGVRLDAFVEAFTATEFGPAGVVEGDPAVRQASSVLDYVFRTLAVNYLGRRLPEPVPEVEAEPVPLLPLDLPPRMRRRILRIVG